MNDNTKLKFTGYTRKTDSGYDSWDDANANADNLMYAFQMNLEKKKDNVEDIFTSHVHVHDRYYDTAVKNKYYSQSYTLKAERKLNLSDRLSFGFVVIIIIIREILLFMEIGVLQQKVTQIILDYTLI